MVEQVEENVSEKKMYGKKSYKNRAYINMQKNVNRNTTYKQS